MYEVNGVIEYAHCFRKEVMAKTPKEAREKVVKVLGDMSDPAIAEFQGGIVDIGIEIDAVLDKENAQ